MSDLYNAEDVNPVMKALTTSIGRDTTHYGRNINIIYRFEPKVVMFTMIMPLKSNNRAEETTVMSASAIMVVDYICIGRTQLSIQELYFC